MTVGGKGPIFIVLSPVPAFPGGEDAVLCGESKALGSEDLPGRRAGKDQIQVEVLSTRDKNVLKQQKPMQSRESLR